jgi:Cysteine-rich CPCC
MLKSSHSYIEVSEMNYTCLGYKTLHGKPTDTYEICKICFWEDDGVQFKDPDFEGGANAISLKQAQNNFLAFGACQEDGMKFVRKPNSKDVKDTDWKPFC